MFFQVNAMINFTFRGLFHQRSILHSAVMSGDKDHFEATLAAVERMRNTPAEVKPYSTQIRLNC